MKANVLATAILITGLQAQTTAVATIVDTGSTNTPGMTVSMGAKGHAVVETKASSGFKPSAAAKTNMKVSDALRTRLMTDLEAAAPVDKLNARHCMKSVSFGSRVFVEYKGVRSPDISCPGQSDPKVEALRVDVEEIMAEARKK
jgi:hypothetical protein